MLADHLDNLTQKFPDCELCAFVDIGTGIVLLTDGKGSEFREIADAMCAEAALLLGKKTASLPGSDRTPMAISSDSKHVNIFMRSDTEANDVLLCRCGKSLPLEHFLPAAQACLSQLSDQDKS